MNQLFTTIKKAFLTATLVLMFSPTLVQAEGRPVVLPSAADDMVMNALTLMGVPYKFGGNSPEEGFDCSGLVQYIYRNISSVNLPRTAAQMAQLAGRNVNTNELAIGDLIFFRLNNSARINHVAVYIGDDRFVHAPRTGRVISIDKLDNRYWMRYFVSARRLFTDDGHLKHPVSAL